jgi:cell division transport system ATP-binding protein
MPAGVQNAIIRMFHVHKRYGPKPALADVSLDVAKNEFLFISGPSGAGKSTLLKLLYLAEPVSDGQILIDGLNLSRIPRRGLPLLRRKFGIIFQDYKLIPTKTIFENVALVLEVLGKKGRLIEKKTRSVLRTVGMEDRLSALPPSLSGGEQQRVAVARAIVGDPKIILADEPTGSLDSEAAAGIFDLLAAFHLKGATIVVATHDRELIQRFKGRTVSLTQGHLVSAAEF